MKFDSIENKLVQDGICKATMRQSLRNLMLLILLVSVFKVGFSANHFAVENDIDEIKLFQEDSVQSQGASMAASLVNPKDVKRMAKLIATAKKIRTESRKLQDLINSSKSFDLPLGKDQSMGVGGVTICIDSVFLTPKGGELCASSLIDVPGLAKQLGFAGNRIGFNRGGFTGDARLMLIGNQSFPLNKNMTMVFVGENKKTYVDWDCNGYRGMGLQGKLEFSRDVLLPADTINTAKVSAAFETSITTFSDFVVDVSLDPFQVKGLTDFKFKVSNAVFDFSDTRNSSGMVFPKGYQSTSMPELNSPLWQGFYLKDLNVEIPSQYRKKNQEENISLFLRSAVIDEMGFTGEFGGTNLIPLEEGDMSGWAYSLDTLGVGLKYNKLQKAWFNGDILIPIAGDTDHLGYYGLIQPDDKYYVKATVKEDMDFPLFNADVKLAPSSYLEVDVEDHRFHPKAVLHGSMVPKTKLLNIGDISFEGLMVTTREPFLDADRFSLGREDAPKKLGFLPIQLNRITLTKRKTNEYGLGLDMTVNVSSSFSGIAEAIILAEKDPERIKFKYAGLDIGKLGIEVNQGSYQLKGFAQWYKNDPLYGSGFKGMVDAKFTPGIALQASALFGSVEGYRYWYADGMFTLPSGVPVFPGLSIYSFGGGVYNRMSHSGTALGAGSIGATPSGIVYVPNKKAGLGLKARADLASPDKAAVTVETIFEMSFNSNGGLNYISFEGNGKFLSPLNIPGADAMQASCMKLSKSLDKGLNNLVDAVNIPGLKGQSDVQTQMFGSESEIAGKSVVAAKAKVSYDFPNKSLHGTFDLFMNVPGGVIQGVGSNGRAGWAELHVDPKDWYFYMGTPEDRVGIKLMRILKTGSYFMVGTKILGSPPPPDEVADILGADDLDYMRDFNALGTGKGFAFGSNVSISTGNLNFLIFYGYFNAGAGFDIMLKNYGNEVRCKGSGKSPGIDGWYANGQAYAYLDGEIGIQVRVFHKRKRIHILHIGAAALLQAQLPNPLWMKGIVGGKYSVLGGLVKGHCDFEVEIGNKCELVGGSVLDELEVISDVTPQNGRAEVDVFTAFQTVFNLEIEKPFEMVDLDEIEKTFRVKLDEMSLTADGKSIEGEIEWNENKDVAIFNSLDILPPESKIDYKVKVSFEEKIGGVWKKMKGQTQEEKGSFTTGVAPDYIPARNIAYSYPVSNQFNFFKDEYKLGYIKLRKGQPYLFKPDDKWDQKMRMTRKDGSALLGDISYADRTVNFEIPKGLITNSVYKQELVNIPKFSAGKMDANVVIKKSGNEDATVNNKKAKEGSSITTVEEKQVYENFFRSSSYNTFKEKYKKIQFGRSWEWPVYTGVYQANVMFNSPEVFGKNELKGGDDYKPLIQLEAQQNNPWFKNGLNPLMYGEYPLAGKYTLDWRKPDVLGTPPVFAVGISQDITNPLITETNYTGEDPQVRTQYFNLNYNIAAVAYGDFKDFRDKVAKVSLTPQKENLSNLLNKHFPFQTGGKYEVIIRYVLPGINKETYSNKLVVPYLMD
ncbi:hypothetical protein [Labilibaculum euxinus]